MKISTITTLTLIPLVYASSKSSTSESGSSLSGKTQKPKRVWKRKSDPLPEGFKVIQASNDQDDSSESDSSLWAPYKISSSTESDEIFKDVAQEVRRWRLANRGEGTYDGISNLFKDSSSTEDSISYNGVQGLFQSTSDESGNIFSGISSLFKESEDSEDWESTASRGWGCNIQ